jgi:hypothetical protein
MESSDRLQQAKEAVRTNYTTLITINAVLAVIVTASALFARTETLGCMAFLSWAFLALSVKASHSTNRAIDAIDASPRQPAAGPGDGSPAR